MDVGQVKTPVLERALNRKQKFEAPESKLDI